MGIFNDIIAVINIQKLKTGKIVPLSVSQIAGVLINLPDAQKKLSVEQFNEIYSLFKELRKCKDKKRMTLEGYYNTAINIIKKFNVIAPYENYSGGDIEEIALLMEEINAKTFVNEENFSYTSEELKYANYIVSNSKGMVSDEEVKEFIKIIRSYMEEGKEKALERFDLLVESLINSGDLFKATTQMSFYLGILNSNEIISEIEMKNLINKYQQDIDKLLISNDINKQMSLDEFNKKVEICLMKNYNYTEEEAKKSVMNYTPDFPMFLQENWTPEEVATAITMGY